MNKRVEISTDLADRLYFGRRIVDALLREDVRECVSRGQVQPGEALFRQTGDPRSLGKVWLRIAHWDNGILWIPVRPAGLVQQWSVELPLVLAWEESGRVTWMSDVFDILACFRHGLDPESARQFAGYDEECRVAIQHHQQCRAEQRRWFAQAVPARGRELAPWPERLMHYERLAAFQDHPFYPTARAKLGFTNEGLVRFAPEFGPSFQLRWLAVPRSHFHPSRTPLPAFWPGFAQVGLPADLAASHTLLPVHPAVWGGGLTGILKDSGLQQHVVHAPLPYLDVRPTLSVRTLLVEQSPDWHIKLPLTIRTLGGKNIRTIKPSTIQDGHRIQSLLGGILKREAGLQHRVLLTDESRGAHVAQQPALGYILRRYPKGLEHTTLVPVAALCACTPSGNSVVEELAQDFFDGSLEAFLNAYLDTTLRLHLLLWVRYGIALESNQQNSVLVLTKGSRGIRLLLKDNDAARIWGERLSRQDVALGRNAQGMLDARILVDDELALAQMFTTITLQLNIAAIFEGILSDPARRSYWYGRVRCKIALLLAEFERQGDQVALARATLLEEEKLPVKYLLTAASLLSKDATGAADVNKYYGKSGPNFLRTAG